MAAHLLLFVAAVTGNGGVITDGGKDNLLSRADNPYEDAPARGESKQLIIQKMNQTCFILLFNKQQQVFVEYQ